MKMIQQHQHHVDERRNVDLRLQTGFGIALLNSINSLSLCGAALRPFAINPTPGSRSVPLPAWPLGLDGS